MKYILHTIDLQNENPWENKMVYLLYTDVVLGEWVVYQLVLYDTLLFRFLEGVVVLCLHELHDNGTYVPFVYHEEDLPVCEVSVCVVLSLVPSCPHTQYLHMIMHVGSWGGNQSICPFVSMCLMCVSLSVCLEHACVQV